MRVIIYLLLSLLIGVLKTNAQTKTTTESSSSSMTVSINGDIVYDGGDLSISGHENSYFSTSDSDDTYRVRAKFNDRKTTKIRNYLLEELGRKNMTKSGSKYRWKMEYNGDTSYEIKLDEGSLRIFVDKELASSQLFNKFKIIRGNIKNYTSGKSDEKRDKEKTHREEERLEREAEQLIREAQQKMREAEQLKREAAQLKKEAKRKTNN